MYILRGGITRRGIMKYFSPEAQLQTLFDVTYESQKKYRELKNIVIDPKFIIEEEEKRQPLSFQE
jgi:hypothetical protein